MKPELAFNDHRLGRPISAKNGLLTPVSLTAWHAGTTNASVSQMSSKRGSIGRLGEVIPLVGRGRWGCSQWIKG